MRRPSRADGLRWPRTPWPTPCRRVHAGRRSSAWSSSCCRTGRAGYVRSRSLGTSFSALFILAPRGIRGADGSTPSEPSADVERSGAEGVAADGRGGFPAPRERSPARPARSCGDSVGRRVGSKTVPSRNFGRSDCERGRCRLHCCRRLIAVGTTGWTDLVPGAPSVAGPSRFPLCFHGSLNQPPNHQPIDKLKACTSGWTRPLV